MVKNAGDHWRGNRKAPYIALVEFHLARTFGATGDEQPSPQRFWGTQIWIAWLPTGTAPKIYEVSTTFKLKRRKKRHGHNIDFRAQHGISLEPTLLVSRWFHARPEKSKLWLCLFFCYAYFKNLNNSRFSFPSFPCFSTMELTSPCKNSEFGHLSFFIKFFTWFHIVGHRYELYLSSATTFGALSRINFLGQKCIPILGICHKRSSRTLKWPEKEIDLLLVHSVFISKFGKLCQIIFVFVLYLYLYSYSVFFGWLNIHIHIRYY